MSEQGVSEKLKVWRATVEHGEVQFGAFNDAAHLAAEEVEYPWGHGLVSLAEVEEKLIPQLEAEWADRLLSDEVCDVVAAEIEEHAATYVRADQAKALLKRALGALKATRQPGVPTDTEAGR